MFCFWWVGVFTSIILCGGESKRMGNDKAFIKINGFYLIDIIIDRLKKLSKNIILVVDKQEKYAQIVKCKDVEILEDENKKFGPIEGMRVGLKKTYDDAAFVCACDMPLLDIECVKEIYKHMDKSIDCVVPRVNHRLHPLHGIYKKSVIPQLEYMVNNDIRMVKYLINNVKTKFVESFGCNIEKSVTNINSPEDLEKLRERGVLYG